MWAMLQRPAPGDYVIATGVTHSVREFAAAAFSAAGLDWEEYVEVDPALLRPAEVTALRGDASLAHRELNWRATVQFDRLVAEMVETDLAAV
jgi:GDPmannose 4,6-dehydratase